MFLLTNSNRKLDDGYSAVPTTGTWGQGDIALTINQTEQGTAGSKYILLGWMCTVGGTPGTWVPLRFLTGN